VTSSHNLNRASAPSKPSSPPTEPEATTSSTPDDSQSLPVDPAQAAKDAFKK
jgi:hypothetical protein